MDPGDEVRFSIELTRLKNLPGLLSLDIKRLRGNVWSFKFVYQTILEYVSGKDLPRMVSDIATSSQTVRIDSLSQLDARSLPLSKGSCPLRFSSVYCIFPRTIVFTTFTRFDMSSPLHYRSEKYVYTYLGRRLKLRVSIIWGVAIFELDDIRSSSCQITFVPQCESEAYIQVGTVMVIHTTSTAPPFPSCASRLTIHETLQRPSEPSSSSPGRPFRTTFLSFTRRHSTGNLSRQLDKIA